MRGLRLGLFLALAGCQMTPTRVRETQQRAMIQVFEKAQKPLVLTENTVILDVRSSFDYGLNRVQNSLHFPWENLTEPGSSGEVLRDKRLAALRLALVGLTPESPVVIVGYGQNGHAEEGRLAWTLLYFGFHDVQISSVEALRKNMTQQSTPPARNVATWPIQTRDELQIDKKDFLNRARHSKERVIIIDVRSESEYLQRPKLELNTINIEWKQFFTKQGRPDPQLKNKLTALGILSDQQILVMCNRGVRSAAASYALLAMGYTGVRNFAGGWNDLAQPTAYK